jgi:hypothetical protein
MRRSLKLLLAVVVALTLSALALTVASASGGKVMVATSGAVGTATPLDDPDPDDDDDGDAGQTPTDPSGPVFSDPRNIDNPMLPITAFEKCKSEGTSPDGDTRSTRKVLDRTVKFEVNGQTVRAVVVRDKTWTEDELTENTLDYFAQADDGTVYYLGEDATHFEDGVADHEGSWRFGEDTDALGVAMPADPQVGDTWMLEDVPDVGTENDVLAERFATLTIGDNDYTNVIRVAAHVTPDNEDEEQFYAEGVGNIREAGTGAAAEEDFSDLVSCTETDD